MSEDTSEKSAGLQGVADRHGVSLEAVRHLLRALESGHGTMAQFDHPDLGGFGQSSRGGMVMVGRMNDHALKARVDSLCTELASALPAAEPYPVARAGGWWPQGLGQPSSVGGQNATRYAYFPGSRRLAVETQGRVAVYDTGEREVTGVSQAQGAGTALRFSGPGGSFSLDDLSPAEPERITESERPAEPPPAPAPAVAAREADLAAPRATAAPNPGSTDILSILERLAELHRKGVLTDAEFSGKKAELLARL